MAGAAAAELKDETVAAWNRYIEATEQRIAEELADGDRFLVLDFGEDPDAARERLLAGEVRVEKMETRAADGKRIRVPKGTIHHWRGSVLIPDVALEDVLHGLIVAIDPADLQDDVVESRVIERDGDRLHLFLRIRRRQLVTADYNTEHVAVYTRHGPDSASSRTTAHTHRRAGGRRLAERAREADRARPRLPVAAATPTGATSRSRRASSRNASRSPSAAASRGCWAGWCVRSSTGPRARC